MEFLTPMTVVTCNAVNMRSFYACMTQIGGQNNGWLRMVLLEPKETSLIHQIKQKNMSYIWPGTTSLMIEPWFNPNNAKKFELWTGNSFLAVFDYFEPNDFHKFQNTVRILLLILYICTYKHVLLSFRLIYFGEVSWTVHVSSTIWTCVGYGT